MDKLVDTAPLAIAQIAGIPPEDSESYFDDEVALWYHEGRQEYASDSMVDSLNVSTS